MDEEAIGAIQRQTVPELLDRPLGPGMFGEIRVHDPAGADVEDHKDLQPLKSRGDHDEEVAREYGPAWLRRNVTHDWVNWLRFRGRDGILRVEPYAARLSDQA